MGKQDKQYSNLGLIVATGQNGEIGINNDLVWRIKEDLKFFKEITMNSYLIMGENTYHSMPPSLPGREYVVLSDDDNFQLKPPKIVHRSLEETLAFVEQEKTSSFWVSGGGMVYGLLLPYVDTMHITEIQDERLDATVYFPNFNKDEWNRVEGEELHCPENDVKFNHVLYLRKNK